MDDATEDLARIIADGLMAHSNQGLWVFMDGDPSSLTVDGDIDCRELARFIIRAMVEKAASA